MKLKVITNSSFAETLVKIYTDCIDSKTQYLIDFIQHDYNDIQGFWRGELHLIKSDDIVRVYTDGKKIVIETTYKTYTSKQRLYQLEERLPSNFIKLSQGEIANIYQIHKLDLNIKGTVKVTFKTGQISFVSRRSIKSVKKALGI